MAHDVAVTEPAIEHVDETGAPCARHRAPSAVALHQLALVGSRAPAFHHDCASKLQGLVMALDELSELAENGDPQLIRAIEAAMDVSRELNGLLNINRALTKPAAKAAIAVRDLVKAAADRVGVALHGALPEAMVSVAVAPMTHALALTIDVAAGTGRGRSLAITGAIDGREVDLVLPAVAVAAQPSNASESLAIATFVVGRDGGRLWCAADDRLLVRLPRAP
jgi:hypothetical protein